MNGCVAGWEDVRKWILRLRKIILHHAGRVGDVGLGQCLVVFEKVVVQGLGYAQKHVGVY